MNLFDKRMGGLMNEIRCDEKSYLIWKWHPSGLNVHENIRENAIHWGSPLCVKEGEVAVFVYKKVDSPVMDFIEGPYDDILMTKNLPVISSIVGFTCEVGTRFQAEVYFINLSKIIQLKFTESQVEMGEDGASNDDIGRSNGKGFNSDARMAGIGLGGAFGQYIVGFMNNMVNSLNLKNTMSPPPLPQSLYYVAINGEAVGPYPISTLQKMVLNHQLIQETLVWKSNMSDWKEAGSIVELDKIFSCYKECVW